ncbi:MAG: SUMF1/EgtB/PvdO family nonheme iron enzyme [Bacteroidaceae bacterium]|nr:SUMF1/EgtB/PvdO family nonheme iron enzyme [Bacteroidaceae bacterium]
MSDNIQDRSMLRIGTILHDTYRIDRYLSSGGFGNTYVATNIAFDERVAIKEFFIKGVNQRDENQTTVSVSNRENVNQFEEQREKFKKEARRLRRLHNDHLVRVHDLFEENGTSYYVMDYVDGESLSGRLKRTGEPMSEAEVWKILPQILDALKTVHGQGIWHLDLKPGNIMIDRQGTVKVIDFGASKQLNAQNGGATTSTAVNYTRGYAPREQEAQHYDKFGPWTDLYALGATVYNLVTGNKPPTSMDVEDDGAAAFSFSSAVSARMRDLIEWLMQPNRTKRPQSVDEVIRSMEQSGHKLAESLETPDDETVYKPKAEKKNETESDAETQYADKVQANRNAAQARSSAAEGNPPDSKKGGKKWWFIGIAAAVLCAVIVLVALGLGKSGLSQEPASEQSEFNQKPLSNRTFTVNGVEFSMVEVEGGTFEMGSNDGDDDEKPVHSVTLSSYYIGQTEVTQALWKAVMGSNPSYFKGDNLPVEQVSWDDCQSFITKLNQLTGERFRLPTEAEWEFAARAGTKTSLYYNGQDIVINGEYNSPNLDPLAWYGGNCGRNFTTSEGCDVSNGYDISDWPDKQYSDSKGGTHSVGRKQPNAFGLYDMLGNVWEWCQDWYGDYSSSSQTNPTGPTSGSYRVLRGGSWRSYVGFCLSADRDFITPGDRCIDIGLRLVLSE